MSGSLMWEPADRKKKSLSTAVKWALQKRFNSDLNVVMGEGDLDYVHGLVDAGVEGAQELLDAIVKHGSIQLTVEY